jgi:hypothetical protein
MGGEQLRVLLPLLGRCPGRARPLCDQVMAI